MEKVRFGGDTPLLNLFKDGAVMVLRSRASEKHLRIMHGKVDGAGGQGMYAQLTVRVRGDGIVALQSIADPNHYLRIKDGKLDKGTGGPWCDFKLSENDGHVCLESTKCPGEYVGIKPDGETKPPGNTKRGPHGQFYPTILNEAKESIYPGTSELMRMLAHGNIIRLKTSSGKNLVRPPATGDITGAGGPREFAQWIVHVRGPGVVALQNVGHLEAYLCINHDELKCGQAGNFCEFKVEEHGGNLTFESVKHPGQHVGITPDTHAKAPSHTRKGPHGQFAPEVIKQQPEYNRAGDTPNMRTLNHLNTVLLYSTASGKTIRIIDDKVNGTGGAGIYARFTVQVRAPGVVALRNVANPDLYLDSSSDDLGITHGAHRSDVKVGESDNHLVFESLAHPGWHIGILPDGEPKPPKNTGTGKHGQFLPKVAEHVDLMHA